MKTKTLVQRAIGLVALLLLASVCGWSQFSSAIDGTVSDPSGAPVPNATVIVKNAATGIEQTTRTSNAGYYRFSALPAATFSVTASATGFNTTLQENVNLQVAETKTVNLALQLGKATTQVTVSSAPPLVETSQGRVAGVINDRQVHDLPLVGRNFYDLVVITPGVTGLAVGGGQAYAQAAGDIFAPEYGVNLSANGQRPEANNYLVDGASVESGQVGDIVNVNPNVEDVQEVSVAVNDFSAQYGRGSSAIVNVITKSGTNDWHGALSWFHTNNVLQSRNIFQVPTGPIFRRNEYAGSVGGPIRKDKTFFFFSADVLKSGVGTGVIKSNFTPQYMNLVEQLYPNNISASLLKSYPNIVTPMSNFLTAGSQAGTNCSTLASPSTPISTPLGILPCNLPLAGQGVLNNTLPRNGAQWTARVDHNLSSKDRLYYSVNRTNLTTVQFNSPSVTPAFNAPQPTYTLYMNLNETHTFSPTLLNEAAMSYVRAAGLAPVNQPQVPGVVVTGMTGGANYNTLFGNAWGPNTFHQNNFEWRDVASYNRGSHTLQTGFDVERTQSNQNFSQVFERPEYTFFNVYDFALDKADIQSDIGVDPLTGGLPNVYQGMRYIDVGTFLQDHWKVKPNLTLDWGLRWETFGNPNSHNNNLTNVQFQGGSDYSSRIEDAATVHVGQLFNHAYEANWMPRMGFAWDPTHKGKLSIRGGAGIFALRFNQQTFDAVEYNPPTLANVTASVFTPQTLPIFSLGCSKEPFCFPRPAGIGGGVNSKGGLNGGEVGVTWVDPNMRPAYSENYFLGVQYSFTPNWMLEGDYIGSVARHLYVSYDVNRINGELLTNNDVFAGLNTSFGNINYSQARGSSAYNGLTIAVKNRSSHGLTFQGSYTVGKGIDEGSAGDQGSDNTVVDANNFALNQGLTNFDVRNRVSASATWLLPRHQFNYKVANALTHGWELTGITILQSGTPFTVYCSAAFQPIRNSSGAIVGNNGCDYNADGFDYDVPLTPSFGNSLSGLSRSDYINGIFNCQTAYCSNIFPTPPLGQEGNLGRNTFIGPGYADTDLSLIKNSKIPWFVGKEGANVQFRIEMYNAFNRVNMSGVTSDLANPAFGKSQSTFSARDIQLGIRIAF